MSHDRNMINVIAKGVQVGGGVLRIAGAVLAALFRAGGYRHR
jgi:hypothetical protein